MFASEGSNRRGDALPRGGLLKIILRIGEAAQVEDCHPHAFRHTFATLYLKAGGQQMVLMELIGHTNPEDGQMTVIYRLSALRCLPYVGKLPEAQTKMEAFGAECRRERGDLEMNSAKRYPAQRLGPGHRRFYAVAL